MTIEEEFPNGTPIQKLEQAVIDYVDECAAYFEEESPGVMSGFVLSWQTQKITSDPRLNPSATQSSLVVGIGTSTELALGLASSTVNKLQHILIHGSGYEDD